MLSSSIHKLLTALGLISSLLLLAIQVIWQHTGFTQPLWLKQLCNSLYLNQKYTNSNDIHFKVAFTLNIAIMLLGGIAFVGACLVWRQDGEGERQDGIGDGIVEQGGLKLGCPFNSVFWLQAVIVLCSVVVAGKYIDTLIASQQGQCLIVIAHKQILTLTILSFIIFLLNLITLILLICNHSNNTQPHSEGYFTQLNKMIEEHKEEQIIRNEEAMESDRKMTQQLKNDKFINGELLNQSVYRQKPNGKEGEQVELETIPKVTSIVYQRRMSSQKSQ